MPTQVQSRRVELREQGAALALHAPAAALLMIGVGLAPSCSRHGTPDAGPDAAQNADATGGHADGAVWPEGNGCGLVVCDGSVGGPRRDAFEACEVLRWEPEDGGGVPCQLDLPATVEAATIAAVGIRRRDSAAEFSRNALGPEGCGAGAWYAEDGRLLFCDAACDTLQDGAVTSIDIHVGTCIIDPSGR